MKNSFFVALIALFSFSSCATLQSLISEPTAFETISALREVLNSSTFRSIKKLQDIQNQGALAVLPDEVSLVLNSLRTLGLGNEIDKVTKGIETASGVVANESAGIMTDAIKEVDFGDAVAIVTGGQDAATQVLKNAMYVTVKKRYSTRLDTELDKTDANKYWPMAATAYNLFAKDKIDNSLSDFMAERAVDAVFIGMGHEETEIRKDPASLGKAVVTKVFDYYKNRNQ
jgi:hypothetical protein